MIDPHRPVKVIHTGTPNPAALRALLDYIIDCAIKREQAARGQLGDIDGADHGRDVAIVVNVIGESIALPISK